MYEDLSMIFAFFRALVLCTTLTVVSGHGYLKLPESRNFKANSDYCPHCLNAGGPGAVYSAHGSNFPDAKYGICGDPFDQERRKHEVGGEFWTGEATARYTKGQVIKILVKSEANHNGLFEFFLCKINGITGQDERNQLTQACFNKHPLVQADVPENQNPGATKFYTTPGDPWDEEYTMYYRLPDDVVCDGIDSRCVIQWHWITANTCNPPGIPEEYSRSSNIATCGDRVPVPDPIPDTPSPTTNPESTDAAAEFCKISKDTGKEFGLYADVSRGCKHYFSCEQGESFEKECPEGTLFSDSLQLCAQDSDVICQIQDPDQSTATKFCTSVLSKGNEAGVYYADEESGCKDYYFCEESTSSSHKCPEGALFNQNTQQCDIAERVPCGEVPPSEEPPSPQPPTPQPPTPQPPSPQPPSPQPASSAPTAAQEFCQSRNYGLYADVESGCKFYFMCRQNVQVRLECLADSLFDEGKQYCDWSPRVSCNGKVTQSSPSSPPSPLPSPLPSPPATETTDAESFCESKSHGLYADRSSGCKFYYMCQQNVRIRLECKGDSLFDESKQYCDWSPRVPCT
eukprot:jgi/Picre1/28670/NNA_004070.t1